MKVGKNPINLSKSYNYKQTRKLIKADPLKQIESTHCYVVIYSVCCRLRRRDEEFGVASTSICKFVLVTL